MRRLRITKVEVLINTNFTGGASIVDALERYLVDDLWTERELERVIPLMSGRPDLHLLGVEVQAPSIEIGTRQRRVHAHFILRIRHADQVVLGRMQPLMQRHVRERTMFKAAFVSVRLLNSAAENYALKESRWEPPAPV